MLTSLPFLPTLLPTLFKTSICKFKLQCRVGLEWYLCLKFTPKIILNYSIFSYLWTHTPPHTYTFNIHTSTCGLFQKVNTKKLGRWVCIFLGFFSAGGENLFITAILTLWFHSHRKNNLNMYQIRRKSKAHKEPLQHCNEWQLFYWFEWMKNSQGKWSFIYVRA